MGIVFPSLRDQFQTLPTPNPVSTAKATNKPFTWRACHTLLSSVNSGARIEDFVGTCQLLFELVTTSKAAWRKTYPLFIELSSFKIVPFPGFLSRH